MEEGNGRSNSSEHTSHGQHPAGAQDHRLINYSVRKRSMGGGKGKKNGGNPTLSGLERALLEGDGHLEIDDPMGLYMLEAGDHPLLSSEEETQLAKRIERGRRAAKELLREGLDQEEVEKRQRDIEDGWLAREKLITSNSRLVISVAKKYLGRGVPLSDLVQEGNIGLMRAMKKFDYRRGFKFSTYATWWIRQAITRSIADHGRTIRLPVHVGDQITQIKRSVHRMVQELGREPEPAEIADMLGIPPEKVEFMMMVAQQPLSLEAPVNEEEPESELGEFIPDDESSSPPETVERVFLEEQIQAALNTLRPRESKVLQLRYGLKDGQDYTLAQVGDKLGITRERVRQIEAQALWRLRRIQVNWNFKD